MNRITDEEICKAFCDRECQLMSKGDCPSYRAGSRVVNAQLASCEQQVKDMTGDEKKLMEDLAIILAKEVETYRADRTDQEVANFILDLVRQHYADRLAEKWVDIPDKRGEWWMSSYHSECGFVSPLIIRVIDYQRPDRGLEVDYDRESIPVKVFVEEYYPKAKWMFISEPEPCKEVT
jgi:hypothetical protein